MTYGKKNIKKIIVNNQFLYFVDKIALFTQRKVSKYFKFYFFVLTLSRNISTF